MRLKFVLTALVTCALAAPATMSTAAVTAPSVATPRAATAGTGYAPASNIASGGPIHGMILSDANKPFGANAVDLKRLADDGVNLVSLYITNYFTSARDPKIVSGALTPTDQQVSEVVAAAHAAGLAVEINPILWSQGPYVWRGAIDPADIDSFWASYSAMILRYAKLSQSDGVELYGIGSEYPHLEKYTGRWRSLAASVRQVYSGKLTYMAVTHQLRTVRFWPSVDYIGSSPYYVLSSNPVPTYAELRAAWRTPFRLVRDVWRKYHRPMLFNEIGYLSAQSATAAPWVPTPNGPASQTVQANAYAALLDAAATHPWMKGIVFYGWSSTSAPVDRTWSPRDKRAECEMARRWASPTAPRLPDGFPLGCLAGELGTSAGLP